MIVGIYLVNAQYGITISTPTTAKIKFIIDSSDTETTTESQSHSIVFAITCVRELMLTNQRSEESTWCTESVDTQGIVATIILCPLIMTNQARWKGIKIKVTHTIRTYNHCSLLLVESIDNDLQSILRGIKVVTIQLNSKATTMRIIDSIVPTATYTEVCTCRNKMHKAFICSQRRQYLRRTICRMIVDNDNVKRKICLL